MKEPTMDEDTPLAPPIGHNMGPSLTPPTPEEIRAALMTANSGMLARRRELIAGLAAHLDAHKAITEDEQVTAISDTIKLARELAKLVAAAHTTAKAPWKSASDAVDAWKNWMNEPFILPVKTLTDRITAYDVAKAAKARADARERAEMLRKQTEEQTRRAMEAASPAEQDVAFDIAEHTASMQAKAEAASTAAPARSTIKRGAVSTTSLRRNWAWRVTDITKVPPEYLMVDDARVREAMRHRDADGVPQAQIPGIEWVDTVRTAIR
jgi:hypothetical protein